MTPAELRAVPATQALAAVPRILTLADRNRHSPTYGCFDRNHWQYKIIDFPSGMAQEFVYPLALAHELDIPGNPYRADPALRELVLAGMRFAATSAHADGSCDDYFPYEKALGATAFSLLACAESCLLLGVGDRDVLDFLTLRAGWLSGREESGVLSNHHALTALALAVTARAAGVPSLLDAARERVALTMTFQDPEGWFTEYQGCDPGYLTMTIAFLARLRRLEPDLVTEEPLVRAARFAAYFSHPDGSFGGEYGSRNTYNFFPHGFELLGREHPDLLDAATRYYGSVARGLGPCLDDDHIIGHHAWSNFLAWQEFVAERPEPAPLPQGRQWFPNAGLLVERRGRAHLVAGLKKGGVFKFFRDDRLVRSDTQVSLRMRDGKRVRTAVAHMQGGCETGVANGRITVSGSFAWAKQAAMTPFKLVVLRLIMLSGGRLFPNLVRGLLQRLLIVGRKPAPARFTRTFTWQDEELEITDEVACDDWSRVTDAAVGPDQTSIHVVMSRVFQPGQMAPWTGLADELPSAPGETLRLTRII